MTNMATPAQFVADVFGPVSEGSVYVASLPNDDAPSDEPGERRVMCRDGETIDRFCKKWDRAHRGLYMCVSTIQPNAPTRSKQTAAEIILLHGDVDLKDLDITLEEVIARLQALYIRPSIIVRSGNGVHAYWLLRESIAVEADSIEAVEDAVKQIAGVIGGDSVHDIVRLMRLPGTHNTKRGAWTEVVIVDDNKVRHELSDIIEWLDWQGPVIERKARGPAPQKVYDNPFLAAAERLGFKPAIDVEQRLASMSYRGSGDSSIHGTQLAVSASLLTRGEDPESVVSALLDATRAAAGIYGEKWNWGREEKIIRRMCEDWLRKNPVKVRAAAPTVVETEEKATGTTGQSQPTAVVHNLKEERSKRKKAKPAKDVETPKHTLIAAILVEHADKEDRPLMNAVDAGGERRLWRCNTGIWAPVTSIDLDIEEAATALDIPTTIKLRSEVTAAIRSTPGISKRDSEIEWDAHGFVQAENGLVDYKTRDVIAYRPEHYATWRLPYSYDPTAPYVLWSRALNDFFRDKDPSELPVYLNMLQEFAGAGLLGRKPRALSRALVLYGPSNAGKSQILNVLTALYGGKPIAQPLSSLEGEHGTVPFGRHSPWVLHEAFNQAKWVLSDKVKQLITSEPILINIKRGAQYEHVFRAPIIWGTNHPPTFKDGSQAIMNRMLIVPCNAGFDDTKQIGLASEAAAKGYDSVSEYIIATEGPGLLTWAVEGLRRLVERGRFVVTDQMSAVARDVYDDSNLASEFIREFCVFDPDKMVRAADFMAAYAVWWGEQKGENLNVPSSTAIGRSITALGDNRIGTDKASFRTNTDRFYGGITLSMTGLDYWKAAETSDTARGRRARLSKTEFEVNQDIPGGWDSKSHVVAMRRAHRQHQEKESDRSSDRLEKNLSPPENLSRKPRF